MPMSRKAECAPPKLDAEKSTILSETFFLRRDRVLTPRVDVMDIVGRQGPSNIEKSIACGEPRVQLPVTMGISSRM
jgi:hypothetical protein